MMGTSLDQPYWSVMIPSYNRAMVRDTLASVLAQDPGPEQMQIQVVDNASPDVDIAAIVRQLGQGRVEYHRNPANIAMADNWNVCVRCARGQWVHILHDDDIVYPGFYQAMRAAGDPRVSERPVGAAFCRVAHIDLAGNQTALLPEERPVAGVYPGFDRRSVQGNAVMCPSIVVRKIVYDDVGGFDPSLIYCPDWVMWVRIAQKYAVWYEPRVLVGYRQHEGAGTSILFRTGGDIAGLKQALDRMEEILPPTLDSRQLLTSVREHMATVGVGNARQALERGDLYAGISQFHEAMHCGSGLFVMRALEQGVIRYWDHYQQNAAAALRAYAACPGDPALLAEVRKIRRSLAGQLLEFDPKSIPGVWEAMRELCSLVMQTGLPDESWTPDESAFIQPVLDRLHRQSKLQSGWTQDLLAALLFAQPQEMLVSPGLIPEWAVRDYFLAICRIPRRWRDSSAAAAALRQLQREVRILASDNPLLWREVEQFLAGFVK